MKASELITDLASIISEHGDLEVVVATPETLEGDSEDIVRSCYKLLKNQIEIYGEKR